MQHLLDRVATLTRERDTALAALRPFAERYHEANRQNGQRSPIDPERHYFVEYKHLETAAALASDDGEAT